MLNKLFAKLFFGKPTVTGSNKSLVLNFDSDAESFTIIQLSEFSDLKFYKKEESKKVCYVIVEGVLKRTGEKKEYKFEFDDEDDAEKALVRIVSAVNGKTKMLFKVTASIAMLMFIIFGLLSSYFAIAPVFATQSSYAMYQQNGVPNVPNLGRMEGNARAQALSPEEQQLLQTLQSGNTQAMDTERQQFFANKQAEADKAIQNGVEKIREERNGVTKPVELPVSDTDKFLSGLKN